MSEPCTAIMCEGALHGPVCVCCGAGHWREPVGEVNGHPVCWYCRLFFERHPVADCVFGQAILCAIEYGVGAERALAYALTHFAAERQVFGEVSMDERNAMIPDLEREIVKVRAA